MAELSDLNILNRNEKPYLERNRYDTSTLKHFTWSD